MGSGCPPYYSNLSRTRADSLDSGIADTRRARCLDLRPRRAWGLPMRPYRSVGVARKADTQSFCTGPSALHVRTRRGRLPARARVATRNDPPGRNTGTNMLDRRARGLVTN